MKTNLKRTRFTVDNKKRFDIYHILSLVLLSVLPVIAIVKGVGFVINGMVLNTISLFTYFALPIIAVLLFFIILLKAKKIWVKVALCATVLVVSLFSFFVLNAFQTYEIINCYENEELQEKYAESDNSFMPELSEISKSEELQYYHYEGSEFVFSWESKTLICKYSADEYLQQKASLDEKYVFMLDDRTNHQELVTNIDGYSFRVLSSGEYEIDYPKEVVLIATNDKTKEIVYLNSCDQDLDYIDSLDEFILDDCGWEHIR